MKKLSLRLAFSTVVLGAFLFGCSQDNMFIEFEPKTEFDKLALETFKKEYPGETAYRDTYINKRGEIAKDDTIFDETPQKITYVIRFKDKAKKSGHNSAYIECQKETKECKVKK